MATSVYFLDVGQGNMTLIKMDDGSVVLYDCNITEQNYSEILLLLFRLIGQVQIDVFINSHRDTDHMEGIKKLHEFFPIKQIWDSGITGSNPQSQRYKDYMELRRKIGFVEIKRFEECEFGKSILKILNPSEKDDPNDGSIVVKVEHHNDAGQCLSSVMLTGDTSSKTWHEILQCYPSSYLSSDVLLASHHGSLDFFDSSKISANKPKRHISFSTTSNSEQSPSTNRLAAKALLGGYTSRTGLPGDLGQPINIKENSNETLSLSQRLVMAPLGNKPPMTIEKLLKVREASQHGLLGDIGQCSKAKESLNEMARLGQMPDIARLGNEPSMTIEKLLKDREASDESNFIPDKGSSKYYLEHIKAISPEVTVISVGQNNGYGHPNEIALEHYKTYSKGFKCKKIMRTDIHGDISVSLKDNGEWDIESLRM